MAIRKVKPAVQTSIDKAELTSTYEDRHKVPAWGSGGAMVQSFHVGNNKDRAILYARTHAEGSYAPAISVETFVDLTLNDLDQYIAELQAIRADLHKEQEEEARRAAEKEAAWRAARETRWGAHSEIPARTWDI